MQPVSRRVFIVGSVAVVVASCSGDDSSSTSSSTSSGPPVPPTSTASTSTATTEPETSVPETTIQETTPETTVRTTTAATTPPTEPPLALPGDPFTLGVASGDPTAETVVLWTRLAPDPLAGGGMPADDIEVVWEMSRDETFGTVEHEGVAIASATYAHSVHASASPGEGIWFYRFRVGEYTSPTGTTRTAPTAAEPLESLRFASASCQNYEDGFYTAHRDLADQRPDFVVFLGDYIYEGAAQEIGFEENVRTHGTPEAMTLDDYRNRYALYKRDADLQAAHATCPWFVIWDDHEVENNYAATAPQDLVEAASFAERRRMAYQAWWEHQPVALPPADTDLTIYRSAAWGSLLSIALLDTRQYRSDQVCGGGTLNTAPACPETFDPARTMIGDEQEAWLLDQLTASSAVWRTIGQQVVFGDVTFNGAVLNYDQWDGYPVQRNRIVQHLADNEVPNVVVLTGDIHFAGIGNIRAGERGIGTPVGVELVATSISSGGRIDPGLIGVLKTFPDFVDAELEHRGYILHTVSADRWTAEYRMVETVKQPGAPMFVHNTYVIDAGTNLARVATA